MKQMQGPYGRFVAMIVTSTLIMFGLMYLNVYALDHVYWSETRAYMTVRSQATVQDVAYMKAMIPHHSIAILTSERARISDPRVRELADGIIESQRREIAEMKAVISDLENR